MFHLLVVPSFAGAVGWPAGGWSLPGPEVVLFEEVPSVEPTLEESAFTAQQHGIHYEVEPVVLQQSTHDTITLIGARKSCVAPVLRTYVARVRASHVYDHVPSRMVTRLARQVDPAVCGDSWYFGVVGSEVSYEPFLPENIIAVPDDVARAVLPPARAVGTDVSVGGHQVGDTWIAWSKDGQPNVVRGGRRLEVPVGLGSLLGVVRVDGRTLLFGATPFPEPKHWLADLNADPITPSDWAMGDRQQIEKLAAANQQFTEERAAESERQLAQYVAVGVAVILGSVPVGMISGALGAAIGGLSLRRGVLTGAIAGPLGTWAVATGLGWTGLTLLAALLLPSSSFLAQSTPLLRVALLVLGLLGCVGSTVVTVACLLAAWWPRGALTRPLVGLALPVALVHYAGLQLAAFVPAWHRVHLGVTPMLVGIGVTVALALLLASLGRRPQPETSP